MAHQNADGLLKVGIEGFAIIDQHFVKRSGKPYAPRKSRAPQNPAPVIQSNVVGKYPRSVEAQAYREACFSATKATVTTAREATLLLNGALVKDFPTHMSF